MKAHFLVLLLLIILTVTACQKPFQQTANESSLPATVTSSNNITLPRDKNILVDASKDGGVWWFPQGTNGFDEAGDHQGKDLADYLRSLGFYVDELPRDAVITDELLNNYSRILRAPPFFPYADAEIAAYKNFLERPGAILLLQDHLSYDTNDKLSELLGLEFKGAVDGAITSFFADDITNGVTALPFIAGAVVTNNIKNPNITVLGSLNKDEYTVLNGSNPFLDGNRRDAAVMGTVNNFPHTKIFFLGDGNAIESIPQPLTRNLVQWLF